MTTNNDIREYLELPTVQRKFDVYQVDSLRMNNATLMFINKSGVDLHELDHSMNCVFLMDSSYEEFPSYSNDFIRVKNPKYLFCKLVDYFKFRSRIQIQTTLDNPRFIGNKCHFDQGSIIGGTDFSPVMGDSRDELIQFPQMGGVKIGDNVVVKYNAMIGKGTFGFTEIGSNTMIDFGCQVGHNCIIGKSCIIAAGTIIGGSTKIGDNTTIGMGSMIRNGITIGSNVSIGMGSVVIHDVPDNSVVVGNPAHIINHNPIFSERGLV